jgi:cytochrome c biogenesis protein CcmG/thiol:disulfide interchange protein DsbE
MKTLALLLVLPVAFAFAEEGTVTDAPGFTLEDVDGNIVNLDSLLTKGPVLMSFWALWCKMCIKELDALKPYAAEFDSSNITLLAISQDKSRSVPKVKPFATSHKWTYTVVLDPENMMRELYNVQAMPTFFIINQSKQIVFTHQGYKPGDEESIMSKIRELCEKR